MDRFAHLEWPFFEPRHAALARAVDDWAASSLGYAHDADADAVCRRLVQELERSDAPGGLLGVLQRGEPCFVHAFGLADLAERRPVARETVFYLASAAKPFTAASVLHAADEGKLALDDAVTKHLPALGPGFAAIRLRQLLDQRSGLPDVYDLAIGLDLGPGVLASNAAGAFFGGQLGDRFGRKYVIWFSILGALPFTLALPYAGLFASAVLTVFIGLIISSATSSIIVFAQELMPHRFGMISGVFFGVAFGIGGLGAAALGKVADHTGIAFVYQVCAFLPAIGLLAIFLPRLPKTTHG